MATAKLSIARLFAGLVLSVPVVTFGLHLDRYPQFYVDEPFYNYPSISYLAGHGYCYQHSPDTPHGDVVWAYNGPLFSRFQTVSFSIFGSTLGTWRYPGFICATGAIGALSFYLIGLGMTRAGALLAVLWVGDRSLMETMLGRPDGLSLLFLALAFILVIRTCRTSSVISASGGGMCIGLACGFHFAAAPFVAAGYLTIALATPPRRWTLLFAYFTLGGGIALAGIVYLWWPWLAESVEQLSWHLRLPMPGTYQVRLVRLYDILGWSRFWAIALLSTWLYCSLIALRIFARRRDGKNLPSADAQLLLLAASLFGAAGLFVVFSQRALYPYYLIYFSCWPLVALVTLVEGYWASNKLKLWHLAALAAIGIVWLPSLTWNATRAREAIKFSRSLDHQGMIEILTREIPPNSNVEAEPELLNAALEARLDAKPLPWAGGPFWPSPAAYLLLHEKAIIAPTHVHQDALRHRKIVFQGSLFPTAGALDYPIAIYSPELLERAP